MGMQYEQDKKAHVDASLQSGDDPMVLMQDDASQSMNFLYRQIDSLPRLSWCAEIRAGSGQVVVHHGNWVETRSDRFFEGAWNGAFDKGDFDQAETLAGSGALLRDNQLIFSPPTDMFMWLASLRAGNRLLVSNSLVFLLARAGDKPAASYPYYFFDVMHRRRWGLRHKPVLMPTHNGNVIDLHPWNNIKVHPDLSIETLGRPLARDFQTYEEYRELLTTTVRDVIANAAHPGRVYSFRPVAAISQGYDSPAAAVAMAAAGCREALTFALQPASPGGVTDNGEEIARCLGMRPQVYRRADYDELNDLTDAEFCATATSGTGAPLVLAEQQLRGAILSSGRPGGRVWGLDELYNLPDLMIPPTKTSNSTSVIEFRLRVGYLHLAVPYIGAVHRASIQRISESRCMQPWSIKGAYNRPIPRRMVEEAGVPRQAFGQQKVAGNTRPSRTMSLLARKDFEVFYQKLEVLKPIRQGRLPLWEYRKAPLDALYAISVFLPGRKKRLYRRLLPLTLRSDRRAGASMPISDLYLFHWAFEKIKYRYHVVDAE
jgi:hypothetical protein